MYKLIEEDKDWLVIEKPAGLTVHAGAGIKEKTLIDFLLEDYPEIASAGDDPKRPGIVQRLDKEVSGLMVVARTTEGFEYLKKQFKERRVKKEYTALAFGVIDVDHEILDFPIKRSSKGYKMAALPRISEKKMANRKPTNREVGLREALDGARDAWTEFTVLKRFTGSTLVKVRIKTGRTHQIRVHFYAFNHPLIGDKLYANKKSKAKNQKISLNRVFLFADHLIFKGLDGEKHEFFLPMPDELTQFIQTLKEKK
ncbi:MAG: RNA pseudouridine synthase [Candidatus Falkowbacteria bacterium]|nr:RNA pseudouridine synthase [Candidatus Falkowbacteria bacterium]